MILDLFSTLDALDSFLSSDAPINKSFNPKNVTCYTTEDNSLYYEILLPGVEKENIKIKDLGSKLEIIVNQPPKKGVRYKYPIGYSSELRKSYTLKVMDNYSLEKIDLSLGILKISFKPTELKENKELFLEW